MWIDVQRSKPADCGSLSPVIKFRAIGGRDTDRISVLHAHTMPHSPPGVPKPFQENCKILLRMRPNEGQTRLRVRVRAFPFGAR
jgi:hypothetical protein